MSRTAIWILLIVPSAAALAIAIAANRRVSAADGLQAALDQHEQLIADAEQVLMLRQRQQRIAAVPRPAQDVIAQVNAALAEAGLSSRHFKALDPEADVPVQRGGSGGAGPAYRRQTLKLTLQDLRPADLGAFLNTWRSTQALWTPARVELLHNRRSSAGAGGGTADQYDAIIILSALYVDS